jgi:hypothetical protein
LEISQNFRNETGPNNRYEAIVKSYLLRRCRWHRQKGESVACGPAAADPVNLLNKLAKIITDGKCFNKRNDPGLFDVYRDGRYKRKRD